jgi:hypothetical protein
MSKIIKLFPKKIDRLENLRKSVENLRIIMEELRKNYEKTNTKKGK